MLPDSENKLGNYTIILRYISVEMYYRYLQKVNNLYTSHRKKMEHINSNNKIYMTFIYKHSYKVNYTCICLHRSIQTSIGYKYSVFLTFDSLVIS